MGLSRHRVRPVPRRDSASTATGVGQIGGQDGAETRLDIALFGLEATVWKVQKIPNFIDKTRTMPQGWLGVEERFQEDVVLCGGNGIQPQQHEFIAFKVLKICIYSEKMIYLQSIITNITP